MSKRFLPFAGTVLLTTALSIHAAQAEKVKIAYLDGMSGASALGRQSYSQVQFAFDNFFSRKTVAGEEVEIELIPFDTQNSPKEALVQFQSAVGQGARYIISMGPSSTSHALVDAIDKHNKRHPGQRVLFFDGGGTDPALTNEKCSFWRFSIYPNADMTMNGLTDAIRQNDKIKSVYIIGQDYSFGKAFSAGAKRMLAEKRPDIEIVGDELHPIGKVKDFTPYAQKIKDSGADAIMTGNWGSDMINLAKAVVDIGISADLYTFYAAGTGVTAVLGADAKDKVYLAAYGGLNPPNTEEFSDYIEAYKAKFPEYDLNVPRVMYAVRMLAKAMESADSSDPLNVAKALEGMELVTLSGDNIKMRAEDHQILTPIQVAVHTDENVEYDYDGSGFGTVTKQLIPYEDAALDIVCRVEHPE